MAVCDARLATTLPHHPKTKKLIRRLGADGPWGLVCLILWTASTHPDGDLSGLSDEDIEIAGQWTGPQGQFVSALREVRFLDGEPGSYRMHDWAVHNPYVASAKERSDSAKWAALCKRYGAKGASLHLPEYATRMRGANGAHAGRTRSRSDADAPMPSPSPSPMPEEEPYRARGSRRPSNGKEMDISGWPSQPSEQVLRDWVAHRKSKRASISNTVLASFGREIAKVVPYGYDADAVLTLCMNRNWQGFEAEWLLRNLEPSVGRQMTASRQGAAIRRARNRFSGPADLDLSPSRQRIAMERLLSLYPSEDPPFDTTPCQAKD